MKPESLKTGFFICPYLSTQKHISECELAAFSYYFFCSLLNILRRYHGALEIKPSVDEHTFDRYSPVDNLEEDNET